MAQIDERPFPTPECISNRWRPTPRTSAPCLCVNFLDNKPCPVGKEWHFLLRSCPIFKLPLFVSPCVHLAIANVGSHNSCFPYQIVIVTVFLAHRSSTHFSNSYVALLWLVTEFVLGLSPSLASTHDGLRSPFILRCLGLKSFGSLAATFIQSVCLYHESESEKS